MWPARSSTSCTSDRRCSYLVDQPLFISKLYKGYASAPTDRCRSQPANPFVSADVKDNPYPYNPSQGGVAAQEPRLEGGSRGHQYLRLTWHGGQPVRSRDPGRGETGPQPSLRQRHRRHRPDHDGREVVVVQRRHQCLPVHRGLRHRARQAIPCSGTSCSWQMANWGAGWIFSPDGYPTGESIFQTGAGSNSGSYSDPTNDANITGHQPTQAPLTQYENYLAKQLPVVFEPNYSSSLTEIGEGTDRHDAPEPVLVHQPGELALHRLSGATSRRPTIVATRTSTEYPAPGAFRGRGRSVPMGSVSGDRTRLRNDDRLHHPATGTGRHRRSGCHSPDVPPGPPDPRR